MGEGDSGAVRPFAPMPLGRIREPFDDPRWFHELKLDGFRALGLTSPAADAASYRRRARSAAIVSDGHGQFEHVGPQTTKLHTPACPHTLPAEHSLLAVHRLDTGHW